MTRSLSFFPHFRLHILPLPRVLDAAWPPRRCSSTNQPLPSLPRVKMQSPPSPRPSTQPSTIWDPSPSAQQYASRFMASNHAELSNLIISQNPLETARIALLLTQASQDESGNTVNDDGAANSALSTQLISQLVNLVKIPLACTIEEAELGTSSHWIASMPSNELVQSRCCPIARKGTIPPPTSDVVALDPLAPRRRDDTSRRRISRDPIHRLRQVLPS